MILQSQFKTYIVKARIKTLEVLNEDIEFSVIPSKAYVYALQSLREGSIFDLRIDLQNDSKVIPAFIRLNKSTTGEVHGLLVLNPILPLSDEFIRSGRDLLDSAFDDMRTLLTLLQLDGSYYYQESINQLMKQIVSFLRNTSQTKQDISLGMLMIQVWMETSKLLEKRDLSFQLELPSASPVLWGNIDMIRQALLSVVFNMSLAYSDGKMYIHSHTNDFLTIMISSDGKPNSSVIQRINTFSYKTGTGLTLARYLISFHGGYIETNVPDGGLEVIVYLPYVR